MSKKSASIINLFLLSLILLSIIGAQLVNFYENNFLLLLLIPLLSLVPILVAFNKIPERCYPFAVIAIALALLFHTSLISMYVWGADINKEYYYAGLTKSNSFWNSDISHPYNAMLSISILAPICSIVSGIDLTWIFKLIFPLLFSFVPLILYETFKRQTDSKTAFLSSFFFMSLFTFFTEMNSVARQQIAEVFFALLMLLVISKHNLNPQKRLLLFIIFCFSLVTAHYALAIIFILMLFFSILFVSCLKHVVGNKPMSAILSIGGIFNLNQFGKLSRESKKISVALILLICIFAFVWYIFIANSAIFARLGLILLETINGLAQFLNPTLPRGGSLIVRETVSQIHEITKYLQLLTQFFIAIGVLQLLIRKKESKFDEEYVIVALGFFILSVAAVILPYISSFLNTTRLYHIVLLVLAPFCVLGGVALIQFLPRLTKGFLKRHIPSKEFSLKILSLLFAIFLLFNSGFIYEIASSHPTSIALSQNSIKREGTLPEKIQLYNTIVSSEEVRSATWLRIYKSFSIKTYADFDCRQDLLLAYALISEGYSVVIYNTTKRLDADSYVYMRKLNIIEGVMGGSQKIGHSDMFNATVIRFQLFHDSNLIYSNGGTEIYLTLRSVLIPE